MFSRVRSFFVRHPLVRDALIWAIPAIVFGAALRLMMLHYLPYAYWGSDSNSYFSFAHKLLGGGYISLNEKRRYLYPLLMVPVTALPGAPLQWLAWLQHGFGLLTLVPLAYVIRKSFALWRLWIVPLTVLFAGHPMILWYEHELLGETIFFALLVWAFAGWVAWVQEPRLERSQQLFWWFFVPLALFLLTKPSGRFVLPGVCVGLLVVASWRKLDRRGWIALAALCLVTLTVGSKKQGAWLLYVATFPLTQIDSPLHAEYKAEIRKDVEAARREIDTYYIQDEWAFSFLEHPDRQTERTLWQALKDDEKKKTRLYMDLAVEGVKARPDLFIYLALQRLIGSANLSEFKEDRFTGEFYVERFEHHYEEAREKEKHAVRLAFNLPARGALPDYAEFQQRLSPAPGSFAARAVQGWVRLLEHTSDFVRLPDAREVRDREIFKARLTPLGWWLCAGLLLSLLPPYTRTLGVWVLIAISYLVGVFLVSQINPRYFGPAWPMLNVVLAVPVDLAGRLALSFLRPRTAPGGGATQRDVAPAKGSMPGPMRQPPGAMPGA